MKVNKKYIMYSIIISILLIIFGIIILMNNSFRAKNINIDDLEKINNDKSSVLIYVMNSDDSKCSGCKNIKNYLDENKINYKIYDRKLNNEDEYNKFLIKFHIDKNYFNYPALIYIKKGKVSSYIMNIKDNKLIDKFISDYNLKDIK